MLEVSREELKIICDILQQYVPETAVWAFGSRVKGTARKYSDLDLVVIGKEKMGISKLGRLQEAFQESELPFRVDVLDWHTLSPEFRRVIKAGPFCVLKAPRGGTGGLVEA